VAQAQQNQAKR